MSSELIVPVTTIHTVKVHPNADALDIIEVLGWQCCAGKGEFKLGDTVVYFPPDAILPIELSDALNVTKYLSKGRVKQIRLRGEPSFGFAISTDVIFTYLGNFDYEAEGWPQIGTNVAELLGITKYEPPVRMSQGNCAPDVPLFEKFTDIQNFRHFPDIITEGEEVYITEKIHGQNLRIGMVEHEGQIKVCVGSHKLRRAEVEPSNIKNDAFWYVLETVPGISKLFEAIVAGGAKQVIVYGESYGQGVQSYHYDSPSGRTFRAFAILVDGKYLDYRNFTFFCVKYAIPMAPLLYFGPFEKEALKTLSSGESKLGGNIKEGVVITPTVERTTPRIGRVILKYLSDDYLLSKHSDYLDE